MRAPQTNPRLAPVPEDLVDPVRRGNGQTLLPTAAREHQTMRTIAVIVERSPIVQASILTHLHRNPGRLDCDTALLDIIIVEDEVRSQGKQAAVRFAAPLVEVSPCHLA